MAEQYRLPTAKVLASETSGDVATVTIEVSQVDDLRYPVAPADLRLIDADLRRPETHACLFEFHQLIAREGSQLVFETYLAKQPLPRVGEDYSFCSWWDHWAMDAVRDLSADWQRLSYPDDGSHAHCLLTYETISAYTGILEGYCSRHGWITVSAYVDYVEHDRLRIRTQWRSCEIRPAHLHRVDE